MYKCLLFDLDDTLFDFKASERKALENTLKAFKVSIKPDIYSAFSSINEECFKLFESGVIKERITFQKMRFERLFEKFGINLDQGVFNDKYLYELSNTALLNDNALETLDYLSPKYLICAATNGISKTQEARLRNSGIYKYFNYLFVSEDIGFNKPKKGFFDFIYSKLSFEKTDYLMIGDRIETDIEGAVSFGFDAILYDPQNKTNYRRKIKDLLELKMLL